MRRTLEAIQMARPIRILLFSTLYPSSARPLHGVFVETRLRELLSCGGVQAKVVAPVPWFPFTSARHGDYAAMASTPTREKRHGLDVLHPRYLAIPKVGMSVAPFLLARAGLRAARQLQAEGFDFDLIDAHYFYPDGVAAAQVAKRLGKPCVITARGSDLNLIANYMVPRKLMLNAARQAAALVGVSQALVERMRELGMPAGKLHMFRNGVDVHRFRPLPQAQMHRELGIDGAPLLLSVGNLVPLKGHDLCIDALAELRASHPQARLLIVGKGPERERLQSQARAHGLADAVTFVGPVPNEELARWYSAADVLLLASSREGWPNVLLEAMACGTPVVATRVGGIPEVVAESCAGRLFDRREPSGIAAAVGELLAHLPDREAVRQYAGRFGWSETSQAQKRVFADLVQVSD